MFQNELLLNLLFLFNNSQNKKNGLKLSANVISKTWRLESRLRQKCFCSEKRTATIPSRIRSTKKR